MPIPDRIERTIDLAQPSQRVYEALTSAEGLGGWFGDRAPVDLRPGGTAYVESTSSCLPPRASYSPSPASAAGFAIASTRRRW
jgi:hypothetical protein